MSVPVLSPGAYPRRVILVSHRPGEVSYQSRGKLCSRLYVSTLARPVTPGRAPSVVTDSRRLRVQNEGKAGQSLESDLQFRLPGTSHQGRYEAGSAVLLNLASSQAVAPARQRSLVLKTTRAEGVVSEPVRSPYSTLVG